MAHIDRSMRWRLDCRAPLIRSLTYNIDQSLRSVDQQPAGDLGSCKHELRKQHSFTSCLMINVQQSRALIDPWRKSPNHCGDLLDF